MNTRALTLARRPVLGLLAAWLVLPAQALQAPRNRVLLTLSGRITRHNAADRADFDQEMLERLPQRSFATATPWHPGRPSFSGPLVRDVLEAVGAQGTVLRCTALTDYEIDMPVEDIKRWPVILAQRQAGQPLSVRQKGPLLLLYPYDSDPVLQSEKYFNRSSWHLRRIEVR